MGNVNEDDWVGRCPKCGDDTSSLQVPVTFELLRCRHCGKQALPPEKGSDVVLYYKCISCGQRYLTPAEQKEDAVTIFMRYWGDI